LGIFDKYKKKSALNRLQEEHLFASVAQEVEMVLTKKGLYAQALVGAEGNEQKAGALYIKRRVQAI
jgi:hypothetical protein